MPTLILIFAILITNLCAQTKNDLDVAEDDSAYNEKIKGLTVNYDKSKPQLFFCGDSISVGYGPALKLALQGKVNALHRNDMITLFPGLCPPKYGGPVTFLRAATTAAMSSDKYQTKFVLINSGLHDIHRGRRNVDKTLKTYLENLSQIIEVADKEGIKVIFVTTTKIGQGKTLMGNSEGTNPLVDKFNTAAKQLMNKNHFVIDLERYSTNLIQTHGEEKIMRRLRRGRKNQIDMVHFNDFAQRKQGEYLASEILKIMDTK